VAQVILYTKTYCPYCDRAKALLASKGVAFQEINLEGKLDEMRALVKQTGMRTVPQIFINGKFVGGFTDLAALDQQGKLDALLAE
jgi:glutaredoxin 3